MGWTDSSQRGCGPPHPCKMHPETQQTHRHVSQLFPLIQPGWRMLTLVDVLLVEQSVGPSVLAQVLKPTTDFVDSGWCRSLYKHGGRTKLLCCHVLLGGRTNL